MTGISEHSLETVDDLESLEYEIDLSKVQLELAWKRVIIVILGHAGALYAVYLRCGDFSLYTEIWMKLLLVVSQFGVMVGYHRLWAHRAYKANIFLQIILVIAASGTYQYSSYDWAVDHRLHHKYSDTNADPHNPSRGFFFSHMGWTLVKEQNDVIRNRAKLDLIDLKNNPVVMFHHKYFGFFMAIFFFFLPTFVPWYFWGESLEHAFFICVVYKWIVNLHIMWSINSFAHKYGYKPYNKKIGPTDNYIGWICSLGEGYHNFHHTFPSDYRASEFSFDCRNVNTMVIDLFHNLGMAYDLRTTPKSVVDIWVQKYGDHSNQSNKYLDVFFTKWAQDFITQLKYFILIALFVYYI